MTRATSGKSPIADPRRSWRRRGQSFGSCLLMIVLVLGGTLFAWQKFGKTRALIRAGEQTLPMKEYNRGGDMEYRRHFREHNVHNAGACRTIVNQLYVDTTKGKFKDKNAEFDQRYYETIQKLLDSIEELDMNSVPKLFMPHHKKLASSYKPFYECCELLKQGFYSEGADQKAKYAEAQKKLQGGWKLSNEGENGIKSNLGNWPEGGG